MNFLVVQHTLCNSEPSEESHTTLYHCKQSNLSYFSSGHRPSMGTQHHGQTLLELACGLGTGFLDLLRVQAPEFMIW